MRNVLYTSNSCLYLLLYAAIYIEYIYKYWNATTFLIKIKEGIKRAIHWGGYYRISIGGEGEGEEEIGLESGVILPPATARRHRLRVDMLAPNLK